MKRIPLFRLITVLLCGITAIVLPFVAVGCGANHSPMSGASPSSTGNSNRGRATVSVRWPEASRLIPTAASSLRIEIRDSGGVVVGSQLLARPAQGGTATATFDPLPIGTLSATATAFPNSDGTGVAQATASTSLVIQAGQTTSFRIAPVSTIDHIEVTPATVQSLTVGQSTTITTVFKNAAGEVVLTNAATVVWTSDNPVVASVASGGAGGTTGRIQALAAGVAKITVTEQESGKTATVSVSTVAVSGGSDNFDDNTTDTSLWEVITVGTGPTVSEVNQRVEITIPANSMGTPRFGTGYKTRRKFRGDFDVQVDYQLLNWPSTNGTRMGIWIGDASNSEIATAHRVSLNPSEFGNDPRESHTGTNTSAQWYVRSATTATSGKLRMVRTNGVFTSYYWDANTNQWISLITGGFDSRDLPITLLAWSGDGEFPDIASKVAFDNFVVNKGELVP